MDLFIGKKVIIYYDDGGRVTRKDGVLTATTEEGYILNDNVLIPKSRTVRIELTEGVRNG